MPGALDIKKERETDQEAGDKKLRELGPPHLHIWASLLRALATKLKPGDAQKVIVDYYKRKVVAGTLTGLHEECKYLRLRKPRPKDKA